MILIITCFRAAFCPTPSTSKRLRDAEMPYSTEQHSAIYIYIYIYIHTHI